MLNALAVPKAILELANVNPLVSVMHPSTMGLPFLPLPIIVLEHDGLFNLIDPYHFPFSASPAFSEIAYVKVPIFIDLDSIAIPFVEKQLPFIDFALLANNKSLPVPLAVHYRSNVEFIIIDRYFGPSESLEI